MRYAGGERPEHRRQNRGPEDRRAAAADGPLRAARPLPSRQPGPSLRQDLRRYRRRAEHRGEPVDLFRAPDPHPAHPCRKPTAIPWFCSTRPGPAPTPPKGGPWPWRFSTPCGSGGPGPSSPPTSTWSRAMRHLRGGVENAAVEFDARTLAPTYRLHYGIPGSEQPPLPLPGAWGFPKRCWQRADGYLGEGEREGLRADRGAQPAEPGTGAETGTRPAGCEDRARAGAGPAQAAARTSWRNRSGAILEKATRRGEQLVRETEKKLKTLLARGPGAAPAAAASRRPLAGERPGREGGAGPLTLPSRPARDIGPREVRPG